MLSAFNQLLNVVGVLSKRVGEMMDKIRERSQSSVDGVVGRRSREAMRIELKKLQDQERRQHSVILRGFRTNDGDLVKKSFRIFAYF